MKCDKCGTVNSNDSLFCSECGNKLEQVQSVVIENGNVKNSKSKPGKKVGLAGSIVVLILSILTMSIVGIILSIISIVKLSSANSMPEGNERQAKIRSGKTCKTVAWIFFVIEVLSIIAAIVIMVIMGVGIAEYISLDTTSIKKFVDDIPQQYQNITDNDNKTSDDTNKSKDTKAKTTDKTTTSKDTTKTSTDQTTSTTTSSRPIEVICSAPTDFDENLKVMYLGEFTNGKLTSLTGTVQIKTTDHDETYLNYAKTTFGCGSATVSCSETNNILTISEKVDVSILSSANVLNSNTTPEAFRTLYTKTYNGTCN